VRIVLRKILTVYIYRLPVYHILDHLWFAVPVPLRTFESSPRAYCSTQDSNRIYL